MANTKSDAVWHEIDVETLSPEAKRDYANYKDLYRQMKVARETFETQVRHDTDTPQGKRLVFGYNFGKLSVAIVDDDRKPAKATPAKQSLADFIASQAQAGRRI